MTTTLPTPSHGLKYTNPETGDKFKYDSDAGAWEGFEGIDESGDSMTGTIAYPDMLINGNKLDVQELPPGEDGNSGQVEVDALPGTNWTAIAYGKGVFVAVAKDGGTRVAYTTNYGETWWKTPSPKEPWTSVAYGNGIFVAVSKGAYYNKTGHAMYSTDLGQTWTLVPSSDMPDNASSARWESVTFWKGKFYAVNWLDPDSTDHEHGDLYFMYSDDGMTWKKYPSQKYTWASIVGGDDRLVAVGVGLKTYDGMTRENSAMWAAGATGTHSFANAWAAGWITVTYDSKSKKFIAGGWNGVRGPMISSDGISWQYNHWPESLATNSGINAFASGDGMTIGLISSSGSGYFYTHNGGSTWYKTKPADWPSAYFIALAYGNGRFLALASNGTVYRKDHTDGSVIGKDPELGGEGGGQDEDPFTYSNLHFNDQPVAVDKGQTRSLARSISRVSSNLGTSKFYQSVEPSDSFGIDNGTLWLNPSNAKLSIYYDSDWNQLN